MEQKQRLFIYDRKEMVILILLGMMITVFAFTLGVHLGKKAESRVAQTAPQMANPTMAATEPDQLPNRQDLTEAAKGVPQAAEQSLTQAIHDETARTGIRLEVKRQIDLPTGVKTVNAGATTLRPEYVTIPAAIRQAPHGRFTLQIGSHPTISEAKDQTDALEALGIKPFMREATVKGKGLRYRVFVGGFPTKDDALKAGKRYVAEHVVDSFMVTTKTE